MYTNIVLVSLAASAVASINYMAVPGVKRDALEARQTENIAACASDGTNLLQSIPTPPPEILKDIRNHPNADPCDFTTPDSLSKVYSSYSSELLSWYSKNMDALSSLEDECPAVTGVGNMLPVCSTAAGGSSPNTATASPTTSNASAATGSNTADNASGTAESTPTPIDNGAVRETGVAFAALVAAGMAVVAL